MKFNIQTRRGMMLMAGIATLGSTFLSAAPVHADKAKNLKIGAIVLGAIAAVQLSKGDTAAGAIAGAGAYYVYKKSKDAKYDERYGYDYRNHRGYDNGYDNNRYPDPNYDNNGSYNDSRRDDRRDNRRNTGYNDSYDASYDGGNHTENGRDARSYDAGYDDSYDRRDDANDGYGDDRGDVNRYPGSSDLMTSVATQGADQDDADQPR